MASMRLCDAMLPALAGSFGAQVSQAAGAVSAFALAYGVLQLVYGPLGDRFGKPRVIGLASWGCALAALLSALAPTLQALVAGRALMGAFAAGVIPLTMAFVGDQVSYEERQAVLARLLSWTVLGMMLGAWMGGAMAESIGWRGGFVVVALLFVLPALALGRVAGPAMPPSSGPVRTLEQIAELWRAAWTRRLLGVVFLEGALVFGGIAFVPTLLQQRLHLKLVEAGALLALFGLGGLVYSRLAGRWLAAMGAPRLASAGAACLACAFVLLAATAHWTMAAAGCLLAGTGFYMLHNTLQTCATQLSSIARGTAVSMFACALFLGQAVGVAASAAAQQRFTPAAWFVAAAPCLWALGLFFAAGLRKRTLDAGSGAVAVQ